MNKIHSIVLTLMIIIALCGCGIRTRKAQSDTANANSDGGRLSSQPTPADNAKFTTVGFDSTSAPIVNPQLGQFPYFTLIEGYKRGSPSSKRMDANKDVDHDRYEFFDGTKMIPIEGRLTTIEAIGEGASAFQVNKTYESLVAGSGGVKVFEGTGEDLKKLRIKFSDERHRDPLLAADQFGVYMIRLPDREIWVESFVSSFMLRRGRYYLTVVEKKGLDVKAGLLAAEEMKKELDARGHVALYINFEFNKSDIKPDSQPIIDEITKLLNDNSSLRLSVEGHTDNVGTPDYNRKLSSARATAVVAALTAKGVKSERLNAVGHGQDKPIADNNSEDGRARNRRVELVKT